MSTAKTCDEEHQGRRSKLADKNYWDAFYQTERVNFETTLNDKVVEEWFERDTETVVNRFSELAQETCGTNWRSLKLLDLGCGNGLTLFRFAGKGFKKLYGIDYSADAIALAGKLATREYNRILYSRCVEIQSFPIVPESEPVGPCLEHRVPNSVSSGVDPSSVPGDSARYTDQEQSSSGCTIATVTNAIRKRFSAEEANFLSAEIYLATIDLQSLPESRCTSNEDGEAVLNVTWHPNAALNVFRIDNSSAFLHQGPFSLVHDKGTFDVFYLGGNVDGYLTALLDRSSPRPLLKAGSLVCITSCNLSTEELISTFASTQDPNDGRAFSLVVLTIVPHRSFQFGGQKGQVVSTVIFKAQ